ncbi:MAG: hypothetical protein FWG22_03900 [Prolixibacteraceae bacterium]|nr:hypothetical protein [Prolixibacteraceae bacterium]
MISFYNINGLRLYHQINNIIGFPYTFRGALDTFDFTGKPTKNLSIVLSLQ